jgi:Tol biopolymer transport system component
MSKCTACGAELQAGNRFCGNCGELVPSQEVGVPQSPASDAGGTIIDSHLTGYLVVESGAAQGQLFQLRDGFRIGRTSDNDMVLAEPRISGSHASIHREEAAYILRDLGSTNGTFLNGVQLIQPQELKEGDEIQIGSFRLAFKWLPASARSAPSREREPQATMVAPLSPPPVVAPPPYIPQQPVVIERASRPSSVRNVLGVALLVILAVAITAVAVYFLLGRPDIGLPFLGAEKAAPVVTLVVTSEPGPVATSTAEPATATPEAVVVTLVVTSEPGPVATTAAQVATNTPEGAVVPGATTAVAPPTATEAIAPTATVTEAIEGSAFQEIISFHSNRAGNWEIYVMEPDGSNVRRLSDNEAMDAALVWSPDGQRAAFTSDRTGDREVFVMHADGSGLVNITNDPSSDSDSSWSPDGTKIAFESGRGGDWDIWVANADGSNPINVTNADGGDGKPVWSPDGTKIAFESARDGNVEIYVVNADGSGQINLSNNPAADQKPQWSPDGRQIAFHTDRDGNPEVYVIHVDGSAPTNLTNNAADDRQPVWSPDGERLAFTSNREGIYAIYIMHHDGSNVIEVSSEGSSWATGWSLVELPAATPPPPTMTPEAAFSLPYNDDFGNPESGWSVSSDDKRIQEYKDGEYQVQVLIDNYSTWSFLPDALLEDLTVQVDIKQISNVEDGSWGILFRYVDQDNWYRVRISPKGTFEVKKKVEGVYIPITNWTASEAILAGQATNQLMITCKGDQIAAFVNGQLLTTVRDVTFRDAGRIALMTQTFSEKPGVHVAYDNLTVTQAGDIPPAVLGTLPMTDDFSNPDSGWPAVDNDDAKYEYRDGVYELEVKPANRLYRVPLPDKVYADFDLKLDATLVEGPDAGYYGIVFRFLNHDNQYFFRISTDGRIRIDKKAAGEYTTLVGWQESPAVNTGQATNHLRITCEGTQCSAYVNDQQVATIDDDGFMQGQIGLVAGNPADLGGTKVHYDNLLIDAP